MSDCGHNSYFLSANPRKQPINDEKWAMKALFDEIIIARLNVYNRPYGYQVGLNCEPVPGRERLLRMFGATFHEDMTAVQPEAQNKASSSSLPVKYSECKRLKHTRHSQWWKKRGRKNSDRKEINVYKRGYSCAFISIYSMTIWHVIYR